MTSSADRPKSRDVRQLGRLARFILPYKGRLAFAFIALLVAALSALALGQGLRYVIDAGFGRRDPRDLNIALGGFVASRP